MAEALHAIRLHEAHRYGMILDPGFTRHRMRELQEVESGEREPVVSSGCVADSWFAGAGVSYM